MVADPHGAVFEIMKPTPMDAPRPKQPAGTVGHASWHELYAGELDQAFAFYAEMFGWKKDQALDMGPMGTYQLFTNQDGQIGGMMKKPDKVPRPGWLYYTQVGDIDAAVERVKAGGGQVVNGPMEVPGGTGSSRAWTRSGRCSPWSAAEPSPDQRTRMSTVIRRTWPPGEEPSSTTLSRPV